MKRRGFLSMLLSAPAAAVAAPAVAKEAITLAIDAGAEPAVTSAFVFPPHAILRFPSLFASRQVGKSAALAMGYGMGAPKLSKVHKEQMERLAEHYGRFKHLNPAWGDSPHIQEVDRIWRHKYGKPSDSPRWACPGERDDMEDSFAKIGADLHNSIDKMLEPPKEDRKYSTSIIFDEWPQIEKMLDFKKKVLEAAASMPDEPNYYGA